MFPSLTRSLHRHSECTACLQDPTELGTFVSAVNCEKCKYNYLLPVQVANGPIQTPTQITISITLPLRCTQVPNPPMQPLDHDSKWACQACDHTEPNKQVSLMLIRA